jgi:hypothetical protein
MPAVWLAFHSVRIVHLCILVYSAITVIVPAIADFILSLKITNAGTPITLCTYAMAKAALTDTWTTCLDQDSNSFSIHAQLTVVCLYTADAYWAIAFIDKPIAIIIASITDFGNGIESFIKAPVAIIVDSVTNLGYAIKTFVHIPIAVIIQLITDFKLVI